jgi:MFS family permease
MLFFPVAAAHVANVSPPDMRGRYQGAWGIAWGLGAVVGPMLGTALFAWNARALWVGCGLCALAGASLVVRGTGGPLRRRRLRRLEHRRPRARAPDRYAISPSIVTTTRRGPPRFLCSQR